MKKLIRISVILISLTTLTVGYHNCAPNAGGNSGSSTATNIIPICPYTSNPAPSIQGIYTSPSFGTSASSVNFRVGQGTDAGTDTPLSLYLNASPNDSYSQIISVKCDTGNSGLTANCGLDNGNLRVQINVSQTTECLSGSFPINVTVTDSVTSPGCQNLAATSGPLQFTVNAINACLSEYREDPTTPYKAGQLGAAVAVDGNWAVASSPGDSQAGAQAGAAYIYNFNGTQWTLFKKVIPSTATVGSNVAAVALSGTTMVLGAALDNVGTGKAWVFQYNGTDWLETKQLMSPTPTMGELFGGAVAVSNGIVAVSAPRNGSNGFHSGVVYAFSGAGFTTVQTITPFIDAAVAGDVLASAEFGTSLNFVGNSLAVGAPFPNSSATRSEAVYVFNSGAGFIGGQKIVNADGGGTKRFGFDVAINGDSLLVGAPFYSGNNLTEVGRVYVYTRAAAGSNFTVTSALNLNPGDPGTQDHFGYSVAVNGTYFLVGAPDKTFNQLAKVGAVYIYNSQGTQIYKVRELVAQRYNDSFGVSVGAISGWLFSGAFDAENDPNFLDEGAAWFVKLP